MDIDINNLLDSIINMIDEIDKSNESLDIIKMKFVKKYNDVPVSIIKLLTKTRDIKIQNENIEYLLNLLDNLQKVKNKEMDFNDCKNKFDNFINERYIYPQLNKN